MNLCRKIHIFIQNIFSQIFSFKHAGYHLFQSLVFPFCYTILLRCVGNGVMNLDSNFRKNLQKLRFYVFTTIVLSESLNISPSTIVNRSFKIYELSRTLDFFQRKYTHIMNLYRSLMKVSTYLDPFIEVVGIGLLISEWISPKIHVSRLYFPRSNLCSRCLLTMHPLQIPLQVLIVGRPSTMECF